MTYYDIKQFDLTVISVICLLSYFSVSFVRTSVRPFLKTLPLPTKSGAHLEMSCWTAQNKKSA